MKSALDKVRARQERLREFNNRTNELGMATPGLGDIWNDIDRLIAALELAIRQRNYFIRDARDSFDAPLAIKQDNAAIEKTLEGK